MSDVDDILKEASTGLNDLLRPAAPIADDYRKRQDARFADFDGLISNLRGPTAPPPEPVERPSLPQSAFYPTPPAGDLRSTAGGVAPTLPQNAAPLPSTGTQPPLAGEPPLVVKRLERPR